MYNWWQVWSSGNGAENFALRSPIQHLIRSENANDDVEDVSYRNDMKLVSFSLQFFIGKAFSHFYLISLYFTCSSWMFWYPLCTQIAGHQTTGLGPGTKMFWLYERARAEYFSRLFDLSFTRVECWGRLCLSLVRRAEFPAQAENSHIISDEVCIYKSWPLMSF